MKIISGTLKGRIIKGHDVEGTRPTIGRVKESLFAMIQNHLNDKVVLDLFAGTGSLGIEALSNGSRECYFVDQNKKMFNILKDNIKELKIEDKTHLQNTSFQTALKYYQEQNIKFDLVFLDPPYQTEYYEEAIKLLLEYNLLNKQAIIVCESDNYNKFTNIKLPIYKERKYGDKWIVIYDIIN